MWSSDSEPELAAGAITTTTASPSSSTISSSPSTSPLLLFFPPQPRRRRHRRRHKNSVAATGVEAEDVCRGAQWKAACPRHPKPVVLAEETISTGAASPRGEAGGVGRARSLTDDDLEELKGCADLGFGFCYDEIPELCGTLPALELCYSMSQRFLDEHQPQTPQETAAAPPSASPPIANWKISSPGDSPEEVKARLKYWAQAVACTVRLCS
ncbi:hypothetical protein ACQ4PT_057762 [Festuca glaucescens]